EQGAVQESANGREALTRLQAHRPDVILLDLMMPEMDGFAVVAALQKEPRWRDIPVIVITARDLDAKDRERLNSGVQSVLVKETFRPGSWSSASASWCGASPWSAAGWKQRRDQSALHRGQRRQRLYAQDASRAARRFRGSDGGGRREGLRDGAERAPRHHPDGSGNAGGRRLGGAAATEGDPENAGHPDHRALGACARGLPRKGARRGMRRVRHQADRIRAAGRDAAAVARRSQVRLATAGPAGLTFTVLDRSRAHDQAP